MHSMVHRIWNVFAAQMGQTAYEIGFLNILVVLFICLRFLSKQNLFSAFDLVQFINFISISRYSPILANLHWIY